MSLTRLQGAVLFGLIDPTCHRTTRNWLCLYVPIYCQMFSFIHWWYAWLCVVYILCFGFLRQAFSTIKSCL